MGLINFVAEFDYRWNVAEFDYRWNVGLQNVQLSDFFSCSLFTPTLAARNLQASVVDSWQWLNHVSKKRQVSRVCRQLYYASWWWVIALEVRHVSSLVPRPFKKRRKGLVHTARTCAGVSIATSHVTIVIARGFCMTWHVSSSAFCCD